MGVAVVLAWYHVRVFKASGTHDGVGNGDDAPCRDDGEVNDTRNAF